MLSISILISSILACLVVGGLVISQGFNDKKVITYGFLTLSMLSVSVFNFLSLYVSMDQLFFMRGVMVGSTISAYLTYMLICYLKTRQIKNNISNKILLLSTIFVAVTNCTDLLFTGVINGVPPKPIINFGIYIFFVHLILFIILSIKQLYLDIKVAKNNNEKRQYSLLIFGLVPTVIFSPLTSFILPMIGISQLIILTPLYSVVFVIFVGYAIIRHGLFDVRMAIVRTFAYILSLLTLSLIYFGLAFFASLILFNGNVTSSISINPINIVLALVLAFIFQPVKKFFDKITNKIFYKHNYDTDEFYTKLNKTLSITTDLRSLLERSAGEIGRTLKSEQTFFFINSEDGHHVSDGTPKHKKVSKFDVDNLIHEMGSKRDVTVASLLEKSSHVRRILISYRIEIALPLTHGNNIIGFLFLGEHLASGYTNRDIKALNTISNELVIAIQNALAVQEIREFNTTLKQRIANATKELRESNKMLRQLDKAKDEFVSMASHQLRTPLTSVKGYLSMVLEGDAGEVTEPQKQLLEQAFNSSERMVGLINDFLNVSRIQTGKFIIDYKTVNLSDLVGEEVDNLRSNAETKKIKFAYNAPQNFPDMEVDENKLRQVVMNFADNAIYYSRDDSTIQVNLSVEGGYAVFTIKDTGIGVPVEEQSQLFTKFFRASNARKQRPDGTGVGIFLAKKIVNDHGGSIIFESVEGKGSTFGFRLPIKRQVL